MLAIIHFFLVIGFLFLALAYFMPVACNICGADAPSFTRSLLVTLLVTAAAFFCFDGLAYGVIQKSQDDINFHFPQGFTYLNWLKDFPPYIKWQILGQIPVLRYVLIAFSLCLAAMLNVLLLKTPYRIAVVVFIIQWVLGLVSAGVFSFVTATVLMNFQSIIPKGSQSGENTQAQAPTGEMGQGNPMLRPGIPSPQQRAATRPGKNNSKQPVPTEQQPAPEGTSQDQWWVKGLQESKTTSNGTLGKVHGLLHGFTERFDPYLDQVKEATHPFTQHLPVAVQEFLDDGGWWLVIFGLLGITLLWLRSLLRRARRSRRLRQKNRRRGAEKFNGMRVDLKLVSDALTEVGANQITIRHRPGRLRLVVIAPSVSYVGDIYPQMAENLLDFLHPGLADVMEHDQPKVCAWPRQVSEEAFLKNLFKEVRIPEAQGRASHWMLTGGTLKLGRQRVYVGLGVFADTKSEMREVRVPKENWDSIVDVREAVGA